MKIRTNLNAERMGGISPGKLALVSVLCTIAFYAVAHPCNFWIDKRSFGDSKCDPSQPLVNCNYTMLEPPIEDCAFDFLAANPNCQTCHFSTNLQNYEVVQYTNGFCIWNDPYDPNNTNGTCVAGYESVRSPGTNAFPKPVLGGCPIVCP